MGPLAAGPPLVEDRVHDLPHVIGALVPLTERCRSFHAVITGSINDHCSSDKSLGYGLRSLTRSQHRINKRGPADSAPPPHHQATAVPLEES
jgi:hypothetical protein